DVGYEPRDAFTPLHEDGRRFACVVAHRRAGKTVAAIAQLLDRAMRCKKPKPRFAYIAPYASQAKDVAWGYLKTYAERIPRARITESELRVDIKDARIRLYGADHPDRLRGLYLHGVVLDEFADFAPGAWSQVIRPCL